MKLAQTLKLIKHRYQIYLDQDDFSELRRHSEHGFLPSSVAHFIAVQIKVQRGGFNIEELPAPFRLLMKNASSLVANAIPDLSDIGTPIGRLLSDDGQKEIPTQLRMRGVFFEIFATSLVGPLLRTVDHTYPTDPPNAHADIFEELQIDSWRDFQRLVEKAWSEEFESRIASEIFKQFCESHKNRPISTLFRATRNQEFFGSVDSPGRTLLALGKSLAKDLDAADPALSLLNLPLGSSRSVRVDFQVPEELDPPGPISGYRWVARLSDPAVPDVVLARATGFLYTCEWVDDQCAAKYADLMRVANQLDDSALQLVSTLLEAQDGDLDDTLDSDLCFCTGWERNHTQQKGLGAILLRETMNLLAGRHRRVKTVYMDSRPMQFREWESALLIPELATEMQSAIESLTQYIESLNLQGFEVKHIFNRLSGMPEVTSVIKEHVDAMEANISGGDNDYDPIRDSVAHAFLMAGLDDLSADVLEGTADDMTVRNVLTTLLLHRRIPYLPVTFGVTSEASLPPASFMRERMEESPDDYTDSRLMKFIDSLPDDCGVVGVIENEDGDFMVGVECSIYHSDGEKTYDVFEFFTLQRVPAPIDITTFLNT